jgi:SAM-dependent methyltransferase
LAGAREEAAFLSVADFVRDGSILDIGVGGGRTAPLMVSLSVDYRGIDYCPTMVDIARSRFPHLQFLKMDARKLTFANASFDLAAFSFNGIDSVDLPGRLEVLQCVHRVLRPGGYFVFSALNCQGAARGDHWPDLGIFRDAGWSFHRQARAAGRFVLGGANWLRLRPFANHGEDMAVGNLSAHDFGLVTLFTSVRAQIQQLSDAGLRVASIYDPLGRPVSADGTEATTTAPWYHYVTRKPVSAL